MFMINLGLTFFLMDVFLFCPLIPINLDLVLSF